MPSLRQQVAEFFKNLPHHPIFAAEPGAGATWPGAALVVGVSGGPDSLALLHLLTQMKPAPVPRLVVAHLNHQLRPESDQEAATVAATAAAWGVTCRLGRADVPALARQRRLGIEEAGRIARYRFLSETALAEGATFIAVAHNADDQTETILMNLARGAGLQGLSGMGAVTTLSPELSPDGAGLIVLRPVLEIPAAALRAYCREQGLTPAQDPSNEAPEFRRNRIRHELLPLLATFNPQIQAQLRQNAAIIQADLDYLGAAAAAAAERLLVSQDDGHVRLRRAGWAELPLSLRRHVLRSLFQGLAPTGAEFGFKAVELARAVADEGEVGASASLPGGLTLRVGYDSWVMAAPTYQPPPPLGPQLAEPSGIALPIPGQVSLAAGWTLTAKAIPTPDLAAIAADANAWHAYLDARAAANLVVQGRRPGDRMRPLGLGGHSKTIKDVMIDRKIPAALRAKWPIVTNGSHPVWLAGHLIDARAAVTATTAAVIQLTCTSNEAE